MKEAIKTKQVRARKRQTRVRAKLHGTALRPRLMVFISNMHMYAQLIDDAAGKTILQVSDAALGKHGRHVTVALAGELGKKLAEAAKAKGVSVVIFDRGSRMYHGRVQAFAEGAREGGLKF